MLPSRIWKIIMETTKISLIDVFTEVVDWIGGGSEKVVHKEHGFTDLSFKIAVPKGTAPTQAIIAFFIKIPSLYGDRYRISMENIENYNDMSQYLFVVKHK